MYLSSLLIDVGDNPDRPRPGRLWLRNLYHVHQRLCMAFPSATRKLEDVHFLKPFNIDEFGNGQVHVERKADSGFLFRVDPLAGGRAVIVVQSAIRPDWDYAFHNAGYLLVAQPDVRSFDPSFADEQHLRFRLLANPTRRLSKNSPDARETSIGKRVPVPTEKLLDWLGRQAEHGGFSIVKDSTSAQPGYVYVNKRGHNEQRLRSVRYDGVLKVTDPTSFIQSIISGIGTGKAFGFGLLSVARVNSPAHEVLP